MNIQLRKKRQLLPKPYGFCCKSGDSNFLAHARSHHPKKSSFPSLHSLHECAALWIKDEVIEQRPGRQPEAGDVKEVTDDKKSFHRSLNHIHGAFEMSKDMTESQIDFFIDVMRKERQERYEKEMDRLALLGEKKVLKSRKHIDTCELPCWYTDFTRTQLNLLGKLEDVMFKDHEEKTVFRTLDTLTAIGMLQNQNQVDESLLSKLIAEYSNNTVEFLCELYKAVTHRNIQEYKQSAYRSHEKFILSGIVFLELPKICVELHKILPPVEQYILPQKPRYPIAKRVKKRSHPLLEKLALPIDWRSHEQEWFRWRSRIQKIPKPVAILPKVKRIQRASEELRRLFPSQTALHEEKPEIAKHLHNNYKKEMTDVASEKSEVDAVDSSVVTPSNTELVEKQQKSKKLTDKQDSSLSKITEEIEEVEENTALSQFSLANVVSDPVLRNWTNPPTACPYKFRKLMDQVGPLQGDAEFFAELKRTKTQKRFPLGRKNLSLNMQNMLLNFEADFHHLTKQADELKHEVCKIYQDVFYPPEVCDPCCSCRETKKSHLLAKVTKVPHKLIDTTAGEELNDAQVIGALAMHSPASSVPSITTPPEVPSHEKLTKNLLVTGTYTTVEGIPICETDGIVRVSEHKSREVLRNEFYVKEIRQVPPCGCNKVAKTPEDTIPGINEDECYGKKYRKQEGPSYNCKEFDKIFDQDKALSFFEDEMEEKPKVYPSDCNLLNEYENEPEDVEFDETVCSSCRCDSSDEHEYKEDPYADSNRVCLRCERKVPMKCEELNLFYNKKRKIENSLKTEFLKKCECVSMTDFLQMDITKFNCHSTKKILSQKKKCKCNQNEKIPVKNGSARNSKHNHKRKGSKKHNEPKKVERKVEKKVEEKMDPIEEVKSDCVPIEVLEKQLGEAEVLYKGEGPFGYRTESEAALPISKTIAYLTDLHPPNFKAETVPVREGGRECHCRENRNNRKVLKYAIAGLASKAPLVTEIFKDVKICEPIDEESLSKKKPPPPVIEGVFWQTPEPSIRGDDEYINEYEPYNSPYNKSRQDDQRVGRCCSKGRTRGGADQIAADPDEDEKEKREKQELEHLIGIDNAIKDPYITEFFTNKNEMTACCGGNTNQQDIRRLRVMKPVCECKNERRIVENQEKQKKWTERQNYLRTLKKESYLHASGYTKLNCDKQPIDIDCLIHPERPHLVLSTIALQTPYATPTPSRTAFGNLSYVPDLEAPKPVIAPDKPEKDANSIPRTRSKSKIQKIRSNEHKKSFIETGKQTKGKKVPFANLELPKNNNIANKELTENNNAEKDTKKNVHVESNSVVVEKKEFHDHIKSEEIDFKTDTKFANTPTPSKFTEMMIELYNDQETKLLKIIREQLQIMKNSKMFVSLNLPKYDKMPQMSYWVTYRVQGKKFFDFFTRKPMGSRKISRSKDKKYRKCLTEIEPVKLPTDLKSKCTFEHVEHWRRKVKKMKKDFRHLLKSQVLNLCQNNWAAFEYGKYPNNNFKEAYFTYVPSKENDIYTLASIY